MIHALNCMNTDEIEWAKDVLREQDEIEIEKRMT